MKKLAWAIANMQTLLMDELEGSNLDRLETGRVLRMCALHRRIGVGAFLAGGDEGALLDGLFRSGELYLFLLQQLAERGATAEVARSASAPLTDALAAGASELALRIDGLLPRQVNPDLEDDEDFSWSAAWHPLCLGRSGDAALATTADAFAATGSEFLGPRAELLRAIAGRDVGAFAEALARLTEEWHEPIEEERGGGVTDLYADLTEWNLFLEGAALVRGARARGVAVEPLYPFIPAALLREEHTFPELLPEET